MYFVNRYRYNCIFGVALLCLVIQAFTILSFQGPTLSNLQDKGSIQYMQAMKNITDTSACRVQHHKFFDKTALAVRPFYECVSSHASACALAESLYIWNSSVGFEQESAPANDKVLLI